MNYTEAQQEKVDRLYAAAEPIFERFGYRKATVEEICKAAGVSKRTYYELFEDKAALFMRMLVDCIEVEMGAWQETLSDDQTATDQIVSFLGLYMQIYGKHPFIRIFYSESLLNEFRDYAQEMFESQLIGRVGVLIERGKQRGEFDPDLDTEAAVIIIDAIMDGLYFELPEITGLPGAADRPTWAREIRRFVIAGLGASRETATQASSKG